MFRILRSLAPFLALFVALGVSAGIASALKPSSGLDLTLRLAATGGIALPNFVIAGFLQSSLTDNTRFTPGLHRVPVLGWLAKSLSEGGDDTDFVVTVSPAIVRERSPRVALWDFPDAVEPLLAALDPASPRADGTSLARAALHERPVRFESRRELPLGTRQLEDPR